MSVGTRKIISRFNKRLQEYFKTVDEETDIPEDKRECQSPLQTLTYDKRYSDEAIEQSENGNHEWRRLITESSPEIAKSEEELYEEYTYEKNVAIFVVTLNKAKILRGIIDIRMAHCAAKEKKTGTL